MIKHTCNPISVKFYRMIPPWTSEFNASCNNVYLHWRSQGYEDTFHGIIQSEKFSVKPNTMCCAVEMFSFVTHCLRPDYCSRETISLQWFCGKTVEMRFNSYGPLFDPYEYQMDLCIQSCHPAGRPAVHSPVCLAKTLMLNITCKLCNQILPYLLCLYLS